MNFCYSQSLKIQGYYSTEQNQNETTREMTSYNEQPSETFILQAPKIFGRNWSMGLTILDVFFRF